MSEAGDVRGDRLLELEDGARDGRQEKDSDSRGDTRLLHGSTRGELERTAATTSRIA
jgi:hypothetical protein